jgi:hypothetical protein
MSAGILSARGPAKAAGFFVAPIAHRNYFGDNLSRKADFTGKSKYFLVESLNSPEISLVSIGHRWIVPAIRGRALHCAWFDRCSN